MTGVSTLLFTDEERILAGAADPESHYFNVLLPRKMMIEAQYAERKNAWLDLQVLILTPIAIVLPDAVRRRAERLVGAPDASRAAKESIS
jgi:hypothetical protein